MLLVSLLRGVGYDAYVVSGYATRDITLMDGTRVDTNVVGLPDPFDPTLSGDISSADKLGKSSLNLGKDRYKIKASRQLKSQFLIRQELKKKEVDVKAAKDKSMQDEKTREVST